MFNDKKSEQIRVPSNTHPGHLYGDTLPPNLLIEQEEEEEDIFHSAYGTPSSIKSSIKNFAGSYSRASVLYTGELISTVENNDEEQLLFKTQTA